MPLFNINNKNSQFCHLVKLWQILFFFSGLRALDYLERYLQVNASRTQLFSKVFAKYCKQEVRACKSI